MIKVAGYARGSTLRQEMTPKVQEELIRNWYEQQQTLGRWNDEPAEFIGMFVDEGVSSRIHLLDRPAGQQLFVMLDRGDYVVFAKFNRAFRGAADAERTINACNAAGIHMIFLDLNIDTTTANGRLQVGIMSVVSQHQRDQGAEMIREAVQARLAHGVVHGTSYLGWRRIDSLDEWGYKEIAPDETQREFGDMIFRMVLQKIPRRDIIDVTKHHPVYPLRSKDTVTLYAAAAAAGYPKLTTTQIKAILGDTISYPTFAFCRHANLPIIRDILKAEERKLHCPTNKIFYKKR